MSIGNRGSPWPVQEEELLNVTAFGIDLLPLKEAFMVRKVWVLPLALGLLGAAPPSPGDELPVPWKQLEGLKDGNYLAPLARLRDSESRYMASEMWRAEYLSVAAVVHSFVGDAAEAHSLFDRRYPASESPAAVPQGSPLDLYERRGALEAILAEASSRQVVMINELHHVAQHRAFTLQLLRPLYEQGFRYLAVETIASTDAALNARRFPLQSSGAYTSEPVFGDLVRTALRLGYKVVPYERETPCPPDPANRMACNEDRERVQARNLQERILRLDPGARILVHAGPGHINEKKDPIVWMAGRFREITGIDPLTIDQVAMTERSAPAYEKEEYRYATARGWIAEPTVFQSRDGGRWVREEGTFDLQVFHPRTRYERGRPDWMRMGGLRRPYGIFGKLSAGRTVKPFLPAAGGPWLVQAYVAGEGPEPIPVDQIVVSDPATAPVLMLPAGDFRIVAIDESGRKVAGYEETVSLLAGTASESGIVKSPEESTIQVH
jgi:hypothetical protein